ncbi:hypothetical protein VL20_4125 [Microcystis panniformis FACHB-1757]|uniref:Uncharacterized protein n=1 Tax=Microcystis panniformis FACHB-1757 TaxID=1638788 RepID=A0A0K1S4K7_9CHRO|nr:hypothetical protein VL20_4125 [Microcystis panniformis FACHB-1757]
MTAIGQRENLINVIDFNKCRHFQLSVISYQLSVVSYQM